MHSEDGEPAGSPFSFKEQRITMVKLHYIYGGEVADWEEHLYHRSLPVHNGITETDDELDIEALLRRGWELVEEEVTPVAATPSTGSVTRGSKKKGE